MALGPARLELAAKGRRSALGSALLAWWQAGVLAQDLPALGLALFAAIFTCQIRVFPHQSCLSSSFFIHASGLAYGGGVAAFRAAIAGACAQGLVVGNELLFAIAD